MPLSLTGFWPWHFKQPLLYIGDAYDRCIVTPIKDKNGIQGVKHIGARQCFMWPNGDVHDVPVHTVVIDTPDVRRKKGLE